MIIITGCGRSGTAYCSQLFKTLGFDVGHETWGADGISAFQVGAEPHRTHYGYHTHVQLYEHPIHHFHVTRHPLRVISSWMGRPDTLKGMLPDTIDMRGYTDLERCSLYWWWWNGQVELNYPDAYRFPIEGVYGHLQQICEKVGIDLTHELYEKVKAIDTQWGTAYGGPGGRKKAGSHRYTHIYNWRELERFIDRQLYQNIREMGVRYGYT